MVYKEQKNNTNWFKDFESKFILSVIILFIFAVLCALYFTMNGVETKHYYTVDSYRQEFTQSNFELEETFTIPKSKMKSLCKVVDKSLGIVCYINAVGGGIQCFKLDDVYSVPKLNLIGKPQME